MYIISEFFPFLSVFLENFPFLQNLPRNPSASLGIGQGMVVVDEMIAASLSYGMKLVVRQLLPKVFSRSTTGAIELIVGVIHLVAAHYGLQTTFIEGAVVRHQGQALDERLNLSPNIRKHGRILGVLTCDAVDHSVPIQVIVRFRLDEGIERVHEFSVADNYHTHATHARAFVVGGLEVYGSEGVHSKLAIKL
jgi:hypothetical protein